MAPHDISLPYGMKPSEIASRLIANGYLPCPLQPRSKAITVPNWTRRTFEPSDFGPDRGVGLKTGNGLVALDMDVYDAKMAQELAGIAFDIFGSTLIREGQSPKKALLYRSYALNEKREIRLNKTQLTPEKKNNKIELLSLGQQIVVAAIHPDTGQPYKWLGEAPWMSSGVTLGDLPEITMDKWTKFQTALCEVTEENDMLNFNNVNFKQTSSSSYNSSELSIAEVQEILSYIDPSCNYDTWLSVTMGIKSLGEIYEDAWLSWSARGSNHKPSVDHRKWHQIQPQGGINFGTVCHLAQENGADLSRIAKKYKTTSQSFEKNKSYEKTEAPTVEELLLQIEGLTADDLDEIERLVEIASGFKSLQRDAINRKIKEQTGITLGTLRAHRSEIKAEEEVPDELDVVKTILKNFGDQNILHANSSTWVWNPNGVWEIWQDRLIKKLIQDSVDQLGLDVRASYINNLTDVLKTEITLPFHKFNIGNPETVNCLSGQLELDNGSCQLKEHCREDYRTTQIPVRYDPQAQAPLFLKFLNEIFFDDVDREQKVDCVLQLIGYTLMSHARHEKFVMLIGNGANGKSVLLSIVEALCGHTNVAGVQPSKFDSAYQRAHLHNKLANIVTELNEGEKLSDAELKSITSGETVTVEHKFKDPFELNPYSTCWFGTNHMPTTTDFSEALFRRAIILTFNRTFTEDEQNPNLKDELKLELSGILNLALDAYTRALTNAFTIPESSKLANIEWKVETNPVAEFVINECITVPSAVINFPDLYDAFTKWTERNALPKLLSTKMFSRRLQRLGYGKSHSGSVRTFKGLKLKR